jgi:hypothetical protein
MFDGNPLSGFEDETCGQTVGRELRVAVSPRSSDPHFIQCTLQMLHRQTALCLRRRADQPAVYQKRSSTTAVTCVRLLMLHTVPEVTACPLGLLSAIVNARRSNVTVNCFMLKLQYL